MKKVVSLYFVASPLQYLAARAIAKLFEIDSCNILIWYKPGVTPIVIAEEWHAVAYMPWPRLEPLPGILGSHKRLLQNIDMVAALVGCCETLLIHSAVFDTETINYFLKALPGACGGAKMHARILPDGTISVRRYPLSAIKRYLQYVKKIRKVINPRLDYWCFSGDRIGSDATFCDRIYVLPGLPHEYPSQKTVVLPPLVSCAGEMSRVNKKRALVIGQPLHNSGLVSTSALNEITQQICDWLRLEHYELVDYKPHPKDTEHELYYDGYRLLQLFEPLEVWMTKTHYDAVVGVRSSALLFARQIYAKETQVLAFGWDKIRFKSNAERNDMYRMFADLGIEFYPDK